jgi:hypothetical protein
MALSGAGSRASVRLQAGELDGPSEFQATACNVIEGLGARARTFRPTSELWPVLRSASEAEASGGGAEAG